MSEITQADVRRALRWPMKYFRRDMLALLLKFMEAHVLVSEKEFLTELRRPYKGARWAGPVVKARSLNAANVLMRDSPYKVIGELVGSVAVPNGDVTRFVVPPTGRITVQ